MNKLYLLLSHSLKRDFCVNPFVKACLFAFNHSLNVLLRSGTLLTWRFALNPSQNIAFALRHSINVTFCFKPLFKRCFRVKALFKR